MSDRNGQWIFDETEYVVYMQFGDETIDVDLYEARLMLVDIQREHGVKTEAFEAIRDYLKEKFNVLVSVGTAYHFNNRVLKETDRLDAERKKKLETSREPLTTLASTPAGGTL